VRLLEEIRAAGYDGGYTQLKAFVHRVRPTPPPETVVRSRRRRAARRKWTSRAFGFRGAFGTRC
jgi:hypothetical protein